MDHKEYNELREISEDMKSRAAKAQGRLETLQTQMQEEFSVATPKAAAKLLKQLKADEKETEVKYETALADFKEKFGDILADED